MRLRLQLMKSEGTPLSDIQALEEKVNQAGWKLALDYTGEENWAD